jgi:hypothetical protein
MSSGRLTRRSRRSSSSATATPSSAPSASSITPLRAGLVMRARMGGHGIDDLDAGELYVVQQLQALKPILGDSTA